ncbi:PKD domain-containing protein [Marivirga arenosa]|uniref:PKD domain-containing protein n=1 Tax=Marivirga arenosa TaxID=3059076 RepID=A0AA51ZWQ9_9BACT|nr:PKD domain-containing protein [Marivirga sp. BKB1-2]WNB18137.1 PKD domain-containing protein [Marivirga sp. BKB1-2]
MKNAFAIFFTLLIFISVENINGQVSIKGEPIICPVDHNSYDTFVPPPKAFIESKNFRKAKSVNIIVNYNGFTEQAKTAYQYAVDIWASLIKSPVQIIIDANFEALGEGVLGQAGPTNYFRDFEGAPKKGTFYPIALAEKLARKNLNGSGDADISSSFNSDFDFYFGLDGDPPANQYDFVSIVLHELGHGLGFTGGVSFEQQSGSWTLFNTVYPSVFTQFVELGDNSPIISLPDNSPETADALTSDDLFFNGTNAVSALRTRPKLFAPSTWNQGSSYSHLDENTYRAGNPNSLMSPQFGSGEAIHDPGITYEIFADMGWVHTYLDHTNNNQLTDNIADPFSLELSINSDTTFESLSPVVVYSTDGFQTTETINMTDSGDGITFTAKIPNPGTFLSIKYYFGNIIDQAGREYRLPVNSPNNTYQINIVNLKSKPVPYSVLDGGDFESNPDDFQAIPIDGNNEIWELGTPGNRLNQAPSGSNVWKTNLNSDIGVLDQNISGALLSPTFDFSDVNKNHELSFNFSMENAFTQSIGLFRTGPFGFHVQYSIDNGKNWQLLGDIRDEAGSNWYNVSEDSPQIFPEEANAGWIQQTIEVIDGDTTFIPVKAKYNVSFLTGNSQVNFRLVFYAKRGFRAEGYNADGVLIDDFEILKSSPTADFTTADSRFIFVGDEVQFQYLSTGASTYSWDFGDGSTSTLENPSHIYSQGGIYDVRLTITSADGEAEVVKENYLTVIKPKDIPYTLSDGGDLEGTDIDFIIENIAGTGFQVGESSIPGKAGTASGSNAIVTGINQSQYENDSEAYIYSPEFNFASLGNYELSFETNYSFEPNWDGFIVEYTTDRGENWTKLNPEQAEGWYNQISDPLSVFGAQVPIFSGNTNNSFERKFTDISFLGGNETVGFRVKFLTDAAEIDAGMAFDNFEISGPEPGPAFPNFISNIQEGCEQTTITFINESSGSITALEWDFGEGAEPRTALGVGPHQVVYNTAGEYNVKLTATDINEDLVVEEKFSYIIIQENHTPVVTVSDPDENGNFTLTSTEGDAYQWFYKDAILPDATSQSIMVQNSGDYKVSVLINGCEGVSENITVLSNDSPLNTSFIAFPNPIDGAKELNYSFENKIFGSYLVTIHSIDGKKILSKRFKKNRYHEKKSIDLKGIESGLYFIKILSGDQQAQRKIIIE